MEVLPLILILIIVVSIASVQAHYNEQDIRNRLFGKCPPHSWKIQEKDDSKNQRYCMWCINCGREFKKDET